MHIDGGIEVEHLFHLLLLLLLLLFVSASDKTIILNGLDGGK